MAEHKPLQGTLIENDEDLGYALSDLVPVASNRLAFMMAKEQKRDGEIER